jgi:hypothetical protein
MTKHTITIEIDLTEDTTRDSRLVLDGIANAAIEHLTDNYGITSYEGGQPAGYAGYDGPFVTRATRRYPLEAPEQLTAGVQWWLNTPANAEDVVAMPADSQDALILTQGTGADVGIVWVDPTGKVRLLEGPWRTLHQVEGPAPRE